ncbi:MAG: ATP-binding cassette domain-containing protein [Paludibacteraceae bacterium]|nr:ATP-binding cassette domain-containing protein [Paludibacteraceae bacterium]
MMYYIVGFVKGAVENFFGGLESLKVVLVACVLVKHSVKTAPEAVSPAIYSAVSHILMNTVFVNSVRKLIAGAKRNLAHFLINLGEHFLCPGSVFIYYILIFYSIINPIKELSRASYNVRKGMGSLERIDKIMTAENPISSPENAVVLDNFKNEIEYKNVYFKYKNDWILEDINLTIKRGKTIALVGQSGSGKSTLVDLLPRFWDVNAGEILIDGVNIKNIPLISLRSLMGNVNQEAILFNDTFYNNIAFGVENATEEEVIKAAKIANAHDFISVTEFGYDTNIGDRGCKLSGGQRQRISIARAILKNPPILILDEATSALDTESEKLVQEALENLMKNRTTIVIAHRLSTVRNADEICVLEKGKIIERGNHDELMAQKGAYFNLQQSQSLK